jgi:3-hydroxy-3-methylglutaryl CoA synthase
MAHESGSGNIEQLLEAIVTELVRGRLRHRALLSALEQRNALDMAEYVRLYQAEEEANFSNLLALLLMPPDEFKASHPEWIEDNMRRFGFLQQQRHGVHMDLVPAADTVSLPELPSGSETPRKLKSGK